MCVSLAGSPPPLHLSVIAVDSMLRFYSVLRYLSSWSGVLVCFYFSVVFISKFYSVHCRLFVVYNVGSENLSSVCNVLVSAVFLFPRFFGFHGGIHVQFLICMS